MVRRNEPGRRVVLRCEAIGCTWPYDRFVRRTGLDLSGGQSHGQVGDRRILGLTASMARDARVSVAMSQLNGFDRLGQCTDLIHLDQNAVGDSAVDASLKPFGVGHKQVITDQLDLRTNAVGQLLPGIPIVFRATVFDRANWILVDPLGQEVDHLITAQLLAIDRVGLRLLVVELGRCYVQGDVDLLAWLVAGSLNRFHDQVEGFLIAAEVRSETTFITDAVFSFFSDKPS